MGLHAANANYADRVKEYLSHLDRPARWSSRHHQQSHCLFRPLTLHIGQQQDSAEVCSCYMFEMKTLCC